MKQEIEGRMEKIRKGEVPEGYKKTKVGIIPEEWKVVPTNKVLKPIKKAVTIESTTEYKEIGIRSHGKGIFHKKLVQGNKLGNKRVFWVEEKCFIVNIVFAWEQAIAITSENERGLIASHRFPMYKPKNDLIYLDYLLAFYQSPRGKFQLNLASPGGAGRNKTLGRKEFAQSLIPLPTIDEQHKFVDILSTWDKAIELKEKLIKEKNDFKRWYMQKLFTNGTRGEPQKQTEIGLVPESWRVVNLIDVCEKPQYGFTDSAAKEGNAQFLRITDITEFGVNWDEVPFCNCHDYKNYELKNGDIVFARIGATTGKSYLIKNPPTSVYASYLIRVRCKDEILPEFLINYFETEQYWSQINARKGDNLKGGVNATVLSKLFTPNPSLDEQEKIAKILDLFSKEIMTLINEQNQLKKQKKGLMQLLLTGIIRVEVN